MDIASSILTSLNQPVLVLDGNFRPLIANPAFYRLFEIESSELEKKVVQDFISGEIFEPDLRVAFESVLNRDIDAKSLETTCTLQTGRKVTLQVTARRIPVKDGSELILVEPRDVTRERDAEMSIKVLNDALQEHIATLDSVNKELDSYSHSVSHDLRTPLRFVNRIAYMLLHEPEVPLSNGAVKQVNMILQATQEMGKLVGNLLVFSQVSREPMKKRRVDLKRLFNATVKELEIAQEGRPVKIEIQELAPCMGDRTLLKEVASNLLSNALKFTRRCESAQIVIGCLQTDGETAYFVRDNGVGFDMAQSDFLFIPFHRLHNPADFEGTGIGLALVKRIVNRHGGRVWAESEVAKGATFYFTLGKEAVG